MRIDCWSTSLQKRVFDVTLSIFILSLAIVIGAIAFVLVKLTSKGPALFCQRRVGFDGHLFTLYKFRTMVTNSSGIGLTRDGDARLTKVGRFLRKLKLDEIPQFYNVLRGDMSLVGPRPKLPEYAVATDWAYRPGITGFATLVFRREEEMLRDVPAEKLTAFYGAEIKSFKARLDRWYMRRASLASDVGVIWKTAAACLMPGPLRLPKPARQVRIPVSNPVWISDQDGLSMSMETESVD